MISITIILIGITAATSVLAWTVMPGFQEDGMLRPYYTIQQNKWYQLVTSGFLHGDLMHLLFNMITLFFFGPVVEQTIGPGYFLGLYFTCLILSGIPTLIRHRENPNYASLGASGAVIGVLFSFILFYPFENIYLFFIPIGIPAIIFGFLFLAYSLFEGKRQSGIINHEAHISGAVTGILFTIIIVPWALEHFLATLGLS
jgi:membrane associated rhomboid family serine protease